MDKGQLLLKKVQRAIKANGGSYAFMREGLDKYGEPTETYTEIEFDGLFHIVASHVSVMTSEGMRFKSEPKPSMLCALEDALQLQSKDYVEINDSRFEFVSYTDVNMFGTVADVSLEEVQ